MPESETIPYDPGWHVFTCPGCGEAVDVSADGIQKLVICPYCNTQFSPEEQDNEAADELLRKQDEERRETELSSLRIRAVSTERRAIVRTRSYWTVLLLALCIIPIKLVMIAVASFRGHARIEAVGYLLMAAACLWSIHWPVRHMRTLSAELRKPILEEPTEPPDFSTLNDGSQRWKNLEQLGGPQASG
jgi:hypothetical protein